MPTRHIPDIEAHELEPVAERERGRAYRIEDPVTRRRPLRQGGKVALPGAQGAADLFSGEVGELDAASRAAPGWTIRVGFPSSIEWENDWPFRLLLVELSVTSGAVTHILEIDGATPFQICVAAERVSARLRWSVEPDLSGIPADAVVPEIYWHLGRGHCPTTAARTFETIADDVSHAAIPNFASRWCLYAQNGSFARALLLPDAEFYFSDDYEGHSVMSYDGDDLVGIMANSVPLPVPPGARHWNWNTAVAEQFRIAFFYGEVFT